MTLSHEVRSGVDGRPNIPSKLINQMMAYLLFIIGIYCLYRQTTNNPSTQSHTQSFIFIPQYCMYSVPQLPFTYSFPTTVCIHLDFY